MPSTVVVNSPSPWRGAAQPGEGGAGAQARLGAQQVAASTYSFSPFSRTRLISVARSAKKQVPCPLHLHHRHLLAGEPPGDHAAQALTAAGQLLERHLPVVRDHRAVLRLDGVAGQVDGEHPGALEPERSPPRYP